MIGNSAFSPSANVLNRILYFIKRSLACLTKETFVTLYSALVRPYLEYSIKTTLKKNTKNTKDINIYYATKVLQTVRTKKIAT